MEKIEELMEMLPWLLPVFIVLAIWEAVWKLIAMWKAARNGHKAWFICLALINTIGILPIIYVVRKNEIIKSKIK